MNKINIWKILCSSFKALQQIFNEKEGRLWVWIRVPIHRYTRERASCCFYSRACCYPWMDSGAMWLTEDKDIIFPPTHLRLKSCTLPPSFHTLARSFSPCCIPFLACLSFSALLSRAKGHENSSEVVTYLKILLMAFVWAFWCTTYQCYFLLLNIWLLNVFLEGLGPSPSLSFLDVYDAGRLWLVWEHCLLPRSSVITCNGHSFSNRLNISRNYVRNSCHHTKQYCSPFFFS